MKKLTPSPPTDLSLLLNPFSVELEEVVLGALLIETHAMSRIDSMLHKEVFYKAEHQLIYEALEDMYSRAAPIDIITVVEELRSRGTLEEVGGAYYISRLSGQVASSAHLETHVHILREKYMRRSLMIGGQLLHIHAADETLDIQDTLMETHRMLDGVEGTYVWKQNRRDFATLLQDADAQRKQRMKESRNGLTGIPTGLSTLDKMTSGFQRGDLVVLAARPSVGKTAMGLHIALSASRAGHKVVVYSIEMQGERLADRMITGQADIDPSKWRSGQLTKEELKKARKAIATLKKLSILVDDSPSMSIDHIRAGARMLCKKKQCDMIILDYLQLLDTRSASSRMNREQVVAQTTRQAKLLAKELNIPVLLLCQLNREPENQPGKIPALEHLRESGAIEQDADVVLLLYRPLLAGFKQDKNGKSTEGVGYVIVAKHRNGETGRVKFTHNKGMNVFEG
ncbi:replicative DNA helicase [Bacteroides sp. 224]|uniref:replicative DNA helicase n=1 Tax=Bacteroides sp. 224 TaxID=2302936 RepID=UPI0013D68E2F|nr:replicative DNA helicase [Bacteroides sp. 224]NDV66629.1 replicative DNA helicase [Bacteroides sp. 224]